MKMMKIWLDDVRWLDWTEERIQVLKCINISILLFLEKCHQRSQNSGIMHQSQWQLTWQETHTWSRSVFLRFGHPQMTNSLKVKFIQATVILGIPILKKDLGHWLQRPKLGWFTPNASCRPIPSIPMFTYDLQTSWYFMIVIPENSRQEKEVI